MDASRTHPSRKAADAAARRALRKIHGPRFVPKSGVDFITSKNPYGLGWRFQIINEAAHLADAERNRRAQGPNASAPVVQGAQDAAARRRAAAGPART